MKTLLTISIILSCLLGLAQNKLTLIIDTIDFANDFDNHFRINLTNQGFANLGETHLSGIVSTDHFPNYRTSVTIQSDSTSIQIPIDQQHGYLELFNVIKKDTIRINSLKQYYNCYKDSSKTTIEYYRVKNGSVSDQPYKVKYKAKLIKKKCKKRPPFKTALTINGQKYFVSIQKRKSDVVEMTQGHGYKPKQTEKNHENYSGTKLFIRSITICYVNWITVNMK